jgi:hypothetical protein
MEKLRGFNLFYLASFNLASGSRFRSRRIDTDATGADAKGVIRQLVNRLLRFSMSFCSGWLEHHLVFPCCLEAIPGWIESTAVGLRLARFF